MKIVLGSDHAGFKLKNRLVGWLKTAAGGRHQVQDVGCFSPESCDYPDFAKAAAQRVARGRASRGILLCGTGIGMAMAANKIPGIRAAVCWNADIAALAAEHNHANILCVPTRFIGTAQAKSMIRAFLKTPFGRGRHARRVRKINQLLAVIFLSMALPSARADNTPADSASIHYTQGLANERRGDLDGAYTELQLAAALDSKNPRMALALGIVASRLGRIDAAQQALENSVALDGNSTASYRLLALIYEKKMTLEPASREHYRDRAVDCWARFGFLAQDPVLKDEAERHRHYLETAH